MDPAHQQPNLTPNTGVPRSRVRNLALRLLGVWTAVAFLSLYSQVLVLYGADGLAPVRDYLDAIAPRASWFRVPTLFWFAASDAVLQGAALVGAGVGVLLALGLAPRICLLVAWVLYLSFVTVGQDFLQFQWDNLLLESLFFAGFVAPSGWRLGRGAPPSRLGVFLLLWLVFRLHVESGLAKLLSGDPTWRDLTAMVSYYETAPLPTWLGWYAHQLPEWAQRASSAWTFVVELAVPCVLWSGARLRLLAFCLMVSLQVVVIATANYTFFNYLTITLCLFVLDDTHLARLWRRPAPPPAAPLTPRHALVARAVATVVVLLSLVPFAPFVRPVPELAPLREVLATYRTINAYHLFASMTLVRREAVLEGSDDGSLWLPYEFHYKPGDPQRAPAFVAPHQPRVDFRLWFLLLGQRWGAPYFDTLLDRVQHRPWAVAPLFAGNPFPDRGPAQLRVAIYRYRFTDSETRSQTGAWWQRELLGYSTVRRRAAD